MDSKRDEAPAAGDRRDYSTTRAQAHPRGAWPPAPRVIARLYASADQALRARLLACLLRPLSPLALVAVAAGAFADLLHHDGIKVALDEATRFSGEQIAELARFVEQVEPSALEQFATLSANNQAALTAFGAAAVMLLLRALHGSGPAKAGASDHAAAQRS